MKKHKYISAATYGDRFEQLFESMCDCSKIAFRKEKTLSNSKIRKRDKKCDYELFLNDISVFVELKTAQIKQGIDYALYQDGKNHKLKFHQICKMDLLIIEWRLDENIIVAITKSDFLKWAATKNKNSFNYKDSLEMGMVITDLEFLKG